MKSKAKAYVCGYIFRFNLSPLASDVFFLSVFGSFLEKIKSRNIGGSFNSRTHLSKRWNRGANPRPLAMTA